MKTNGRRNKPTHIKSPRTRHEFIKTDGVIPSIDGGCYAGFCRTCDGQGQAFCGGGMQGGIAISVRHDVDVSIVAGHLCIGEWFVLIGVCCGTMPAKTWLDALKRALRYPECGIPGECTVLLCPAHFDVNFESVIMLVLW